MTPRVRWTFRALVVVAVLSTGALSSALGRDPSAATGLVVAGSGVVLGTSSFLALRVLLAGGRLDGSVRQPPRGEPF